MEKNQSVAWFIPNWKECWGSSRAFQIILLRSCYGSDKRQFHSKRWDTTIRIHRSSFPQSILWSEKSSCVNLSKKPLNAEYSTFHFLSNINIRNGTAACIWNMSHYNKHSVPISFSFLLTQINKSAKIAV